MDKNLLSYLKGSKGETWQQALQRFELICHQDLDEYVDSDGERVVINLSESYDNGSAFEVYAKVTQAEIQQFENRHAIKVPPEIVALLCQHGPFSVYKVRPEYADRSEPALEIYDDRYNYKISHIMPLTLAIQNNFGSFFAEEMLTAEQISYLDTHYFCFGYYFCDFQMPHYLFFDKNGNFGSFSFESEDYPGSMQSLTPLLSGNLPQKSLDELLSEYIDLAMAAVLEYSEVNLG